MSADVRRCPLKRGRAAPGAAGTPLSFDRQSFPTDAFFILVPSFLVAHLVTSTDLRRGREQRCQASRREAEPPGCYHLRRFNFECMRPGDGNTDHTQAAGLHASSVSIRPIRSIRVLSRPMPQPPTGRAQAQNDIRLRRSPCSGVVTCPDSRQKV